MHTRRDAGRWSLRAVPAISLCLAASLHAQAPAGGPVGLRTDVATPTPAAGPPAVARLERAAAARAAGNAAESVRHGLAALELHPASPAVLRGLLQDSAASPDARAIFGLALHLAVCDARGRPQLERADKEHALVTMCCGGGLGTGTLLRRG